MSDRLAMRVSIDVHGREPRTLRIVCRTGASVGMRVPVDDSYAICRHVLQSYRRDVARMCMLTLRVPSISTTSLVSLGSFPLVVSSCEPEFQGPAR
jgi:hypothetical protein